MTIGHDQERYAPADRPPPAAAAGPATRSGSSPAPPGTVASPAGYGPHPGPDVARPSPAPGQPGTVAWAGRHPVSAMLEARSVALVGASPRPGTFGQRMVEEVAKSPARPEIHLINPRYREIDGRQCLPSLADLPGPVDLVLLGVPDTALERQLTLAARRGDRSAVIFGNAYEEPAGPARPGEDPAPSGGQPAAGPLRQRLAKVARAAGMPLCGAGCMGFVNVARGLRAIGYTEPDPLPAGPVALVSHSGSVFSAMLRTRRAIGYTVAVSSGQELVTAAAGYLDYALGLPETKVLALVMEAIREPVPFRQCLAAAAERDIPVVLLAAGRSASGAMMVAAHSGALAADDGGWEALARAYGVHRVGDLAELADTAELFAIGRRAARRRGGQHGQARPTGVATVHDSGLERAHTADLADEVGVPFAAIGEATKARLAGILDPGLTPANPLDVWGTGADTRGLFATSLVALAEDPAVAAVALAVDLVHELDGDDSYRLAALDAAAQTTKPLVVLGSLPSAVDTDIAVHLRQHGIPVLEGLRTGLLALRHLLDHASPRPLPAAPAALGRATSSSSALDPASSVEPRGRRERGRALLASGAASGPALLALLGEYGVATAAAVQASNEADVLAAAESIGYPVVLKTAAPAVAHKSDVGGVVLGIPGPAELARAYAGLAARLGPLALVCENVPAGTELAVGIARDPELGPLIVVGAGGVLVELLADRAVALPPVDEDTARQMIAELRVSKLLAGARGAPPADLEAITRVIMGVSALADDLGGRLAALDVNPLICGPHGAIAVDVLALSAG
jgi:acetate---CoA ligase (ADP-forming)